MTQIKLPQPQIDKFGNRRNISIPSPVQDEKNEYFKFCFDMFDREHPLFNLGNEPKHSKAISGEWFISLLDCLKEVSAIKIAELKKDTHDLHPVNWKSENINTSKPAGHEQLEYWQFRINKGNGRVIGVKIDNKFYIVWLDPYHNLTNSNGYGKAKYYYRPKTEYELLQERYEHLKIEYAELSKENETFEKLFDEMSR